MCSFQEQKPTIVKEADDLNIHWRLESKWTWQFHNSNHLTASFNGRISNQSKQLLLNGKSGYREIGKSLWFTKERLSKNVKQRFKTLRTTEYECYKTLKLISIYYALVPLFCLLFHWTWYYTVTMVKIFWDFSTIWYSSFSQ